MKQHLHIIYILALFIGVVSMHFIIRPTKVAFSVPINIGNIKTDDVIYVNALTTKKNKYKTDANKSDEVATLYIENDTFNTKIVQGKDNNFYLNHDINKRKSKFGTPFLDYRTDLSAKKLIIYGHNSRNINMVFKVFENYYNKDYLNSHKNIILQTNNEKRIYEIFSVYIETDNWDYLDIDFPTRKSYFDHLNELKSKSMYEIDTELDGDEDILIIQTCSTLKKYSNYNKKFLLIISRRVR